MVTFGDKNRAIALSSLQGNTPAVVGYVSTENPDQVRMDARPLLVKIKTPNADSMAPELKVQIDLMRISRVEEDAVSRLPAVHRGLIP
jgi:hypothetical protein